MQMTYNCICFFPLIHHQVSIINSPMLLMILLKNTAKGWLISNNLLINPSKSGL